MWHGLKIFALLVAITGVVAGAGWILRDRAVPTDFSGPGCLVLAYHRVIPQPSFVTLLLKGQGHDEFTIYEREFKRQVQALKAHGANFIRPQELESILKKRSVPPQKCVLITLDDGDVSQYQYIFPILKEERIPFAFFVVTGQVGAAKFHGMEMTTWPQIKEMVESGLATVGSHTHNMHELGSGGRPIFVNPEYAKPFADDLQTSIQTLQQALGTRPQYFAYPFGFGTPHTDEAALHLGIHLIFSLREGLVRPGDPAFFVKRVMITFRNPHVIDEWIAQTMLGS
jgi:poly-beta-1,6-N-acetyl-D-glucosamine N-deacetylase